MLVVDDEKESPATREEQGDPRASTIIMPPLDPLEKCECTPRGFFLKESRGTKRGKKMYL